MLLTSAISESILKGLSVVNYCKFTCRVRDHSALQLWLVEKSQHFEFYHYLAPFCKFFISIRSLSEIDLWQLK